MQRSCCDDSRMKDWRAHRNQVITIYWSQFTRQTNQYLISLFCYVNPFPNKPWFLRVYSTSLLKTLWEKEKLLVTSNFSFSHSVFYLFEELSAIFNKIEIVVCKPLSIWTSLKLAVWERVKCTCRVKNCKKVRWKTRQKAHIITE